MSLHRADPRVVVSIAVFLSVTAIALERAYAVGRFAMAVEQVHS